MKIFNNFEDRVNFVDENNLMVGYIMNRQCCEDFGWRLYSEKMKVVCDSNSATPKAAFELDGYFFDKEYGYSKDGADGGLVGSIMFKMTNPKGNVRYLELYNYHEGYYTHGFSSFAGDGGI